jgi:serine/threonine protein kinase
VYIQTFCCDINERKYLSHPNILPVIDVSKTPFPFYIMSPWMPGGNITQHIQRNPDVNRLTLVCVYQPEAQRG